MIPLLVALLAQVPAAPSSPFAQPVPVEVWMPEGLPLEALSRGAKLPGATLALGTRSNMLAPDVFRLASRQGAVVVRVSSAVVQAHVDQYRKLGRATLVVALPERPDDTLKARLSHLGTQTVRYEVKLLDEARAAWLSDGKNAEVELDARGRVPDQDEWVRFKRLTRARRTVRIAAGDPPELLVGLKVLQPSRLVVEAPTGALPEKLVEAAAEAGIPVRVRVAPAADPKNIKALAHLPGLSLEVAAEDEKQLATVERLLEALARPAP